MSSRPFRSLLLVVVVAVGGLTACNSTPSARRVAFDVIDTLDVSDSVKECMRTKVEGYSKDDIEDFAKGAEDDNAEAKDALQAFEDDLAECRTGG